MHQHFYSGRPNDGPVRLCRLQRGWGVETKAVGDGALETAAFGKQRGRQEPRPGTVLSLTVLYRI